MNKVLVLGTVLAVAAVLGGVGCSSSSSSGQPGAGGDAGPDGSSSTVATHDAGDATTPIGDGGATPSSDGGDATTGSGDDAGAFDLNAYIQSLPPWPTQPPNSDSPVDGGADGGTATSTGTDGKQYSCTTTQYSITDTPTEIVTFNPNVDVLWPGALLQGGPLQSGSLVALPITQRAPLAVSIPTLLFAGNTTTVQSPTEATVEQAVGQIIGSAVTDGVQASASTSYNETQVYSTTQAALSLGISAKYLTSSLSASFNASTSANMSTVMGYFVQNMFTVTVPEPEKPSDLFSGLTQDELNQQIQGGNIGPGNLPVYVSSVTYGRILVFSITSSESASDIQAALNGAFGGGAVSVSASASYQELMSNASTTYSVLAIGGSEDGADQMIQTGDPSAYFSSDPAISTGVPISYTLRNLADDSVAAVSEATSYSVKQCNESALSGGANVYVLNGDGTILGFDDSGNSVSLPGLSGPISGANGLAYDSKDDEIYVSLTTSTTFGVTTTYDNDVRIIGPDGTPIQQPSWSYDTTLSTLNFNSISYDPLHDRLYWARSAAGVVSYTTAGAEIESYAATSSFGSAFDPYNGWLYTTDNSGNTVQVFDLSGTAVGASQLATGGVDGGLDYAADAGADAGAGPAFPGLTGPDQIVYDSHHDILYVSSGATDSVLSFHSDGQPAGSFSIGNGSTGLAYDDVNDHLLVVDGNDGLLLVFNPDGTRVTEPSGAFSGLSHASRVIVRP